MSEDVKPRKRLSSKCKHEEVDIELADGTWSTFVVKEMNGTLRDQYLTEATKRVRVDKDGKPVGIQDHKGAQAQLIEKCLFHEDGRPVGADLIQTWSSSTQSELVQMCNDINGLTKLAAEAEKKD